MIREIILFLGLCAFGVLCGWAYIEAVAYIHAKHDHKRLKRELDRMQHGECLFPAKREWKEMP